MVSFVGVSHYSYPVNFYSDESGSGQSAHLALNILPGQLFGAQMRHIPEGGAYRFRIQNLQGKVVGRIVMPSKQFNDASDKDGWQLVLKPTPIKPRS